jgi:hypothetical protein
LRTALKYGNICDFGVNLFDVLLAGGMVAQRHANAQCQDHLNGMFHNLSVCVALPTGQSCMFLHRILAFVQIS